MRLAVLFICIAIAPSLLAAGIRGGSCGIELEDFSRAPCQTGVCSLIKPEKPSLEGRALSMAVEVMKALKKKDMKTVSSMITPEGLRFSPYAYIEADSGVVPKKDLGVLMSDKREYLWGYEDGSGEPIKMSFGLYYDSFVYDVDYLAISPAYNLRSERGTTVSNIEEVYPGSVFVEFFYPGSEEMSGMDWKALRLVFVERDGKLMLAAIVHDLNTI